jgi:hypothetical protein
MSSAQKWLDMLKEKVVSSSLPQGKPQDAPVGDGLVRGAANAILEDKRKKEKALRDALGE